MTVHLGTMKRVLRHYIKCENEQALVELNAIIAERPNSWLPYYLRGKVHLALQRYRDAIADFKRAQQSAVTPNARNMNKLRQSLIYTAKLLHRKITNLPKRYQGTSKTMTTYTR